MSCKGKEVRTVVPEANDGRMGFVAVGNDLVVGFKEAKDGGDDDVKGDNNMVGLYGSPLEVMFSSYSNRRGESEGERYDGFVISKME